jgi:prephenate dehydrogenase
MRPVCVIGLGLIGGSLLRAAHAAGRTGWGCTAAASDAAAAAAAGYEITSSVDDALARAAAEDAIVVVAVPLPAVDEILARVAAIAPECLLTDVVSVKGPVVASVRRITPAARYAGGHPMAGAAESGWVAGSASLFDQAAWVVTVEPDTVLETWRIMADLALDCGSHVVPTTAAEHDAAVARVSHLPHVLAAVLASTGADGGPLALALAAGSFTDGTRVAGARPELVLAMCEGNRAELLAAVDEALGKLGAARGALASTGSLRATIQAGSVGRAALVAHRQNPRERVKIELSDPAAVEALRELGGRGGRILSIVGDSAQADVPQQQP